MGEVETGRVQRMVLCKAPDSGKGDFADQLRGREGAKVGDVEGVNTITPGLERALEVHGTVEAASDPTLAGGTADDGFVFFAVEGDEFEVGKDQVFGKMRGFVLSPV